MAFCFLKTEEEASTTIVWSRDQNDGKQAEHQANVRYFELSRKRIAARMRTCQCLSHFVYVATSVDVTHVTSRFYKLPPFNVSGAVAHTYLFFFSGPGVKAIAKTTNPSIAQDRRRAKLHGAMSFISLR